MPPLREDGPPLDDTDRGTRKVISKWLRKKDREKGARQIDLPASPNSISSACLGRLAGILPDASE